jgi:DNA-binding transcriptional ArsR family regulator
MINSSAANRFGGICLNKKTTAAFTVLLVMLALSVSFAAAYSPNSVPQAATFQNMDNTQQQLSVTVPLVVGAGLQGNSTSPLNQPTRIEIYNYIKDNPGVHFRGICDKLHLSVGVVQYHLDVLQHAGLIDVFADGQNRRYFDPRTCTETNVALFSLLRHQTANKILTVLAQNGSVLHKDIACSLGITSQALSWQMKQLKETGLITSEKSGVNVRYSLSGTNVVALKCALVLTSSSRT